MINIVVDEEVEESFDPPSGIVNAVMTACEVAGYKRQEPKLCIRFAPDCELKGLNTAWRDRDSVTDVLSFPMQEAPDFNFSEPLGDIALAVPFIVEEAKRLGLPSQDHVLHLIVHATLHLLGFDHVKDSDADEMQSLEIVAMRVLGLHHPYSQAIEERQESL